VPLRVMSGHRSYRFITVQVGHTNQQGLGRGWVGLSHLSSVDCAGSAGDAQSRRHPASGVAVRVRGNPVPAEAIGGITPDYSGESSRVGEQRRDPLHPPVHGQVVVDTAFAASNASTSW
jgi:hypothetical protein